MLETTKTAQIPEGTTGGQRRTPVGQISLRQTFRALRHSNYRLFFYGQLVSLIGTWMDQTAMSWLVYSLTGSKLLLGAVAAAGSAPMMIFSLWGGAIADRYPKRRIITCTQLSQMFPAFILAFLVWRHLANTWLIVACAVITGTAMAFDMPARQAFTLEMTSREDLLNAISLNSSIFHGARVIGPSLAGLVIGAFGTPVCFLINGFSFIAVIFSLRMMKLEDYVPPKLDAAHRPSARSGLVYVWQNRRVRTILLLLGVVGIFGWSYAVLLPAFARDVFGRGANGYGVLMSASGIGALIGALSVATAGHVFSPRKMALAGVWIFSGALFGFSQMRNFHVAFAFMTIAGFGMLLFFSTSNTVMQTIVPDEMRGRVLGVWGLVFGSMIPLGSLEAGSLADWLGAPFALAFGSVICAIAGLVALIVIRRREAAEVAAEASSLPDSA